MEARQLSGLRHQPQPLEVNYAHTLIGANWKMHKNPKGTTAFFEKFLRLVERSGHCEIVICPTLLDVENAVTATRGTRIEIGAQNLYWEDEGAFTGEVSGSMIKAAGCSHVIVGHRERRHFFGETNEEVLKKTVAALDAGLIPIVCIGERERNNVEAVINEQFRCGISTLSKAQFAKIVIAYEPIWAIGDGETASPKVAAATHQLIRAQAKTKFGADAANDVRSYTVAASSKRTRGVLWRSHQLGLKSSRCYSRGHSFHLLQADGGTKR